MKADESFPLLLFFEIVRNLLSFRPIGSLAFYIILVEEKLGRKENGVGGNFDFLLKSIKVLRKTLREMYFFM